MILERKKQDKLLLFDLGADPGEKDEISKSRAEDVERLSKARAEIDAPGR
jgi:hypothetical protein